MGNKTIGYRIKTAREDVCMTQEALASAIGCTMQHISAIERGVKLPRLDTLLDIANVLGVTADVLLQDQLLYANRALLPETVAVLKKMSKEDQRRWGRAIAAFSEEE